MAQPALVLHPAQGAIVLGYSGGGDSTALLRQLCAEGRDVFAAIVDHNLREGSAADAARAKAIAREAGAEAEILTIAWPEAPRTAQARARDARLNALARFAHRHGASELYLAHTLDDQAETVLIRLAAQSSWRGLAGMAARAPFPIWPEGRGLAVVRPLLTQRRAALRDALRDANADWIEDPANALTRFTRVRARARIAEWDNAPRWAALAGRFAALAAILDAEARTAIADAVALDAGEAQIQLQRFTAHPEPTQIRALSALLTAIGGAVREPAEDAVARVLEAGGTLAGAWARRVGDMLHLARDPGGVLGRSGREGLQPLDLSPNQPRIWDNRLALTALEPGWSAIPGRTAAAPLLTRGDDETLTLTEASDRGLCRPQWLIRERIAHLLWR
jgi:tRNA(Ile)-lysidine synthase